MDPSSQVFQIPELARNLLLQTDYETIINYCRTHIQAQIFCRDPLFWEQKAYHDFGTSERFFRDTNLSPIERYKELLFLHGGVALGVEKYEQGVSETNGYGSTLNRAIKEHRDDIIQDLINKGYKIPDQSRSTRDMQHNWIQGYYNWYNYLLQEYAKRGDRNMVNQLSKLADQDEMYGFAAGGALEGGHLDLFRDLKTLADNNQVKWNWTSLLSSAAKSGNQQVFDYVLSLVPPNTNVYWEYVLRDVIKNGPRRPLNELFVYILSIIPANYQLQWHDLLIDTAEYDNPEIFDHVLSLAQTNNTIPNWETIAGYAIHSGLIRIFNHLRSLVPGHNWNWNGLLADAIISNRENVVNYILSLVPPNFVPNWQQLVKEAIDTGRRDMFDYILSLAGSNYQPNWQQLAEEALRYQYKDMFDYIRSLAPPDYNWDWDGLLSSIAQLIRAGDPRPLYNYVSSLAANQQ